LLSKIAHVFKENMVVGTKTKDSIQYHDVFDGREAVVCLFAVRFSLYTNSFKIEYTCFYHKDVRSKFSYLGRKGIGRSKVFS